MQIAEWNDSYKTGYAPVDQQHQEMFRLINALHAAILVNKDREILSATLEKVTEYTLQHFRAEEALMASVNYPQELVHKRKHAQLAKEVQALIDEYATGRAVLSISLAMFLANWWRQHIKEDDLALIKYIQGYRTQQSGRSMIATRIKL